MFSTILCVIHSLLVYLHGPWHHTQNIKLNTYIITIKKSEFHAFHEQLWVKQYQLIKLLVQLKIIGWNLNWYQNVRIPNRNHFVVVSKFGPRKSKYIYFYHIIKLFV